MFVELVVEMCGCEFAEVVLERGKVAPLEKARSLVPGCELAEFGVGVEEPVAAVPFVLGSGAQELAADG